MVSFTISVTGFPFSVSFLEGCQYFSLTDECKPVWCCSQREVSPSQTGLSYFVLCVEFNFVQN